MSTSPDASEVTHLLRRLANGESQAAVQLAPLVYDELHRLARRYMSAERPEHTLQATALVNEAWIRMADARGQDHVENRRQFFFVAARAMRQALIEHARSRSASKRGGGATREPFDELIMTYERQAVDLVALDEALDRLARVDPPLVRIVELRFFAGLDHKETAQVLGTSVRSVERGWASARAWLAMTLGVL